MGFDPGMGSQTGGGSGQCLPAPILTPLTKSTHLVGSFADESSLMGAPAGLLDIKTSLQLSNEADS